MASPTKIKICIGFGEKEGTCQNPAGSSHSKLWCQPCDNIRLETISKSFRDILDSFEDRS